MRTIGQTESVHVVSHEEFDRFVNEFFKTSGFDSAASEQTENPLFFPIDKVKLSDWEMKTVSLVRKDLLPHNAVETILLYLVSTGEMPEGNYAIVD